MPPCYGSSMHGSCSLPRFYHQACALKSNRQARRRNASFFGCRHPEDFIYRAKIEEMERALGGRLRIVTAFSRVNRAKKVYVQDRVQEMEAEALRLLSEGAKFYICGHANMAREVGKSRGGNGEEE